MSKRVTRRALLAGGAALAAGACLPSVDGTWEGESCLWTAPKITMGHPAHAGRVFEIHDPAITSNNKLVPQTVTQDLKKLLLSLTARTDLAAAWATLLPGLAQGDVVGIKVNSLNPRTPTQPVVVKALVDLLKQGAGLAAAQIVVWDRRLDELTRAGLTAGALGATVEGTWETITGKGAGRGYEYNAVCLGGSNTRLSNILTRRVDHLINVAVVKRHNESGVTACMKNHYGSIDNPGEFHDKRNKTTKKVLEKNFVRAIPALNALDEVAGTTRLWLLDATRAVCDAGTEDPPDCIPNTLAAGLDPVALDLRARQIRDEQRLILGVDAETETTSEGWLDAAVSAGLGMKKVDLNKVT